MRLRTNVYWLVFACSIVVSDRQELFGQELSESIKPLRQAHAHNDYEHDRPLMDALEQGFTSVEADVYLVEGEILVAHDLINASKERTLEELYLQPLQKIIQSRNGRVFPSGPALILLVDIKQDGSRLYPVLEEKLKKYDEMISRTIDGRFVEKAVTVVISGDRPIQEVLKTNPRYAGIDGRLSDLESDQPRDQLPLISDNWAKHFLYRGTGVFSSEERKKLHDVVERAHAKGRQIRFWATPESEILWRELKSANVDLIGTDDLSRLARFLRE